MMSLAKSLARSGVTKQDRPVSATPVSYWLGLLRSWKGRERVRGRRPLCLTGSQLRPPVLLWVWRWAWTRTHKQQPAPRSVTEQEPGRLQGEGCLGSAPRSRGAMGQSQCHPWLPYGRTQGPRKWCSQTGSDRPKAQSGGRPGWNPRTSASIGVSPLLQPGVTPLGPSPKRREASTRAPPLRGAGKAATGSAHLP